MTAIDCGNLPFDEANAAGNRETIRNAIATIPGGGAVPVVLGGDDSVPIPVFEALAGQDSYTILQIDALIDWRDEHMGERPRFVLHRATRIGDAHVERINPVGARGIGSARLQDV